MFNFRNLMTAIVVINLCAGYYYGYNRGYNDRSSLLEKVNTTELRFLEGDVLIKYNPRTDGSFDIQLVEPTTSKSVEKISESDKLLFQQAAIRGRVNFAREIELPKALSKAQSIGAGGTMPNPPIEIKQ